MSDLLTLPMGTRGERVLEETTGLGHDEFTEIPTKAAGRTRPVMSQSAVSCLPACRTPKLGLHHVFVRVLVQKCCP